MPLICRLADAGFLGDLRNNILFHLGGGMIVAGGFVGCGFCVLGRCEWG